VSAAPGPRLLPIEELNRLPPDAFAEALRPLFEAAGPLGERLAARRPFASYQALLDRADSLVDELSPEAQVVVVNAHPRIGESAAVVRQTSALSYREQGYDAEAGLAPEQLERVYADLARLNAEYEARHGFRFVAFVNGRPKAAILEVLRERIDRPGAHELQTALHEMLAIARDRLRTLNGYGNRRRWHPGPRRAIRARRG
jgi:OHCU decarboxylase